MSVKRNGKKDLEAAPGALVRSQIEAAPLLAKTKVTRRNFADYRDKMLMLWTPAILPEFMRAIERGLRQNEPRALQLAAEIFEFTSKAAGVSVTNNILNANMNAATASATASGRGIDAILRDLARPE